MASAVLHYEPTIREVAKHYRIPASVLAGLIQIESGGDPTAVSPAGAFGLTQFMPGTAPSYGVKRGTSHEAKRSQIFGAGKYLVALGYHNDPKTALARYNGGPGNPQYGYARDVLVAAKDFQGLNAPSKVTGRKGGALAGAVNGRKVSATSTVTVTPPEPGGSGQAADIAAALGQRPQVQLGPLPEYQYSALRSLHMPSGAGQLPSLGGPVPRDTSLDQALSQVSDLQGQPLPVTVQGQGKATVPGAPSAAAPAAGGGAMYVHPIGGKFSQGRIDNGVDYETVAGSALLAVGSGKIVNTNGNFPGTTVVLKLDHPYKDRFGRVHSYVYYGHLNGGLTVKAGQRVRTGQIVARSSQSPAGASTPGHVEIGWARDASGVTQTGAHAQGALPWGVSFNDFATKHAKRVRVR